MRPQHRSVNDAASRNHIRHQTPVTRMILTDDNRDPAHQQMPGQHRLNLAQLNPEPPDLHLIISPARELQVPVRPPPHQVTRPVHTLARHPERASHKTLRRQPRTTQITTRQPRPGNIKLTHHPHRNSTQPSIQHKHPGIRNRRADRRNTPALQRIAERTANRRFRRTIRIDHPPPG